MRIAKLICYRCGCGMRELVRGPPTERVRMVRCTGRKCYFERKAITPEVDAARFLTESMRLARVILHNGSS